MTTSNGRQRDDHAFQVSVVIPNFNQTRYLRDAVRSALEQTHRPLEVIVVDDGSTDDCRDVVAQFGDRVRYIYQENQGLAGARNTGIRAARGALIGLLDADDLWQPTFLETIVSLVAEDPQAAVYHCSAQAVDQSGRPLPEILGRRPVPADDAHWQMLRANWLMCSAMVVRKEAILRVGLFDARLRSCEDWDLWLRLLRHHRLVSTDAPRAWIRLHPVSLSTRIADMQFWAMRVVEGQFGPDDGRPDAWSMEKRRAYGGIYRYVLLTTVQGQHGSPEATAHLRRALACDPTLASDVQTFYDLALGSQPKGYRGTTQHLDLARNVAEVLRVIDEATGGPGVNAPRRLRRTLLATAHHAMGLVAYNTGNLRLSRRLLARALWYRPALCGDRVVMGDLLRTCVGLGPRALGARLPADDPRETAPAGPTESSST